MHILVVGVDYKSAPIEIREKVSFQPNELARAMVQLKAEKHSRKYHRIYLQPH